MFTLFLFVVMAVFFVVAMMSGETLEGDLPFSGGFLILFVLFCLGMFVPSIAVQVRRLHDQDRSGWWVLLNLVPYLGALVLFVFMLLPGTNGANRFGPDPKRPEAEELTKVFR